MNLLGKAGKAGKIFSFQLSVKGFQLKVLDALADLAVLDALYRPEKS
jgi:hypothetical protein